MQDGRKWDSRWWKELGLMSTRLASDHSTILNHGGLFGRHRERLGPGPALLKSDRVEEAARKHAITKHQTPWYSSKLYARLERKDGDKYAEG